MFMFNPVTLSNPFTPNQLGRYNGLQYFLGSKLGLNRLTSDIFITGIGDLDNDGYDDLSVSSNNDRYILYGYAPGVPLRNLPRTPEGFTPAFPESVPIDLEKPSPRISFNNKPLFEKYDGTNQSFTIGQDVNGDGFKEVFVTNGNLPAERQNYVLFGKPNGFRVEELFADPGNLDGKKGFYHPPGINPKFDGDVNGDKIIDLAFDNFIFFGTKDNFPGVVHRDLLDGKNGFRLKNGTDGRVFRLTNLKDINGDSRDDLAINDGRYILFSPSNLPAEIDVGVSNPGLITAIKSRPRDVYDIRPIGDVNRDGFSDFVVVEVDILSSTSGKTDLFYGTNKPFKSELDVSISRFSNQKVSEDADLYFEYGVYNATDFNNDGYLDLLMSETVPPGVRSEAISVTYIAFGSVKGFTKLEIMGSDQSREGSRDIGDFNGDGIPDLRVTDRVLFGGRTIQNLTDDQVNGRNGILLKRRLDDPLPEVPIDPRFPGRRTTFGEGFRFVGDVNGDGKADLAKEGFVVFGTDRINNKDKIIYQTSGGSYNHFEFPDFGYTNVDALVFRADNRPDRADWVYGGWGNDTLTGQSGQMDQFAGGPGNDRFVLNKEYGLQIGKGFAVVWDFDKGIDKVVVHGTANDYFFVEDNNAWLDNKNASFLRHRSQDTSATVNTILARRCNCEFGAVMIAAFSDVKLDVSDLSFVPNTTVV